jgi:hypothetical protein
VTINSASVPLDGVNGEGRPRICMPTSRYIRNKAFQCSLYEAQDILVEAGGVDLIPLMPESGLRFNEKWQRRLLYRDISKKLIFWNPGIRKVRIEKEYDAFIAVCQNYWDLPYLNAIEGWKDHCRTSICWINEMWAAEIPNFKYWLHVLKRFDHVILTSQGTVTPLSSTIGQQCDHVPGAVDVLRFSPYPNPPAKVIDVYSIGRRTEEIHQSLLRAAASRDIFYVHDTGPVGDLETYDYKDHREVLANFAKRSRFFMVAPGKINIPSETHGQVEVGHRYYEGASAGAVLIGREPECDVFKSLFHWKDAVIPIRTDGSDVIEVLNSLGSQPEVMAAISQRNASQSLLRHDWIYRWKEIFRIAGIQPSAGMATRERCLKELAIQSGWKGPNSSNWAERGELKEKGPVRS